MIPAISELEMRCEKVPFIVDRRIADEVVLVPIGQDAMEMDSIYTLDGVGAHIWSLIDGTRTLDQIATMIQEEYDADDKEVQEDLISFVKHLESIGALEIKKTND